MDVKVRKKRFVATPSDATVEVTPQLQLLVLGLAKYGHLDSSHVDRLTGWGGAYRERRLRELFDRGIITKPKNQVRMFGVRYDIITLDRRGIRLVKDIASWEKLYLSRAKKASSLPHKVTHGGNMVGIERSCIDTPTVRFMDTWEIEENAPNFKGKVGWDVDVHWKGENHHLEINPDTLAGFHFLEGAEGKNKVYFVVETDLGTENEVRTNWHGDQSSILRKLICYLETREQGILQSLFSIKKKVFTIVNEEARIETKGQCAQNPLDRYVGEQRDAHDMTNVVRLPLTRAFSWREVERFKGQKFRIKQDFDNRGPVFFEPGELLGAIIEIEDSVWCGPDCYYLVGYVGDNDVWIDVEDFLKYLGPVT